MSDADLLILGTGPTGLFAAFYAGSRGLRIALVDSLPTVGGQLAALYPEKLIYDVPAFPAVRARDLVERLRQQADFYQPTYHLAWPVATVEAAAGGFTLRGDRGTLTSRTLLIAGGVGALAPRRLPASTGADRFIGCGVAYSLPDSNLARYAQKRVLVLGAGDEAVRWALRLSHVAASVTLAHRRDQPRTDDDTLRQLRASTIRLLPGHDLAHIEGDDHIRSATLYHHDTTSNHAIEIDDILVSIGYESSLGPLANWNLALQGGQIVVDPTMMTSRPGIFAAGDICTYPGKLKLLANAFAEAATAANHAAHFLNPAVAVFPGHSTNWRR